MFNGRFAPLMQKLTEYCHFIELSSEAYIRISALVD